MFIRDPGADFFPSQIPDPRSRVEKIPGIRIKNFIIFNPETDTQFTKIRSGMFIPDLDFFPSRIHDPDFRTKKASDPGSRSTTLLKTVKILT
jgi:hypothetical protein